MRLDGCSVAFDEPFTANGLEPVAPCDEAATRAPSSLPSMALQSRALPKQAMLYMRQTDRKAGQLHGIAKAAAERAGGAQGRN